MNKQTRLSLQAYILMLPLLEVLDELEDNSKQGVKHHSKQLIKAIESQDKEISKVANDAGSILSEGVQDMLNSLMSQISVTEK
tara:strand:+ start:33 stop:281 length:249 start_codon:yes stop_codon:yes gene_type:complete